MNKVAIIFLTLLGQILSDDFTEGNQKLSASLYTNLVENNDDNFFVSPFALEVLFGMAQSGAVGSTGEEIRNVLNFPNTQSDTENALNTYLRDLSYSLQSTLTLEINIDQNYTINPDFQWYVLNVYSAFMNSVPSGIALTTGLSFRARFPTTNSTIFTKPFYKKEKSVVNRDVFALEEAEYNYAESTDLDAKFVEMPFVDSNTTVTFVLPNTADGLALIEKNIEAALNPPEYSKEIIQVTIPVFKKVIRTDLTNVFKNLGMTISFDPDQADFSTMVEEDDNTLHLEGVRQMVYLSLNPDGVNTDVSIAESKISIKNAAVKEFTLDHPFFFYVKFQDAVILEGRIIDPVV